jgi:hypothetical protein
MGLFPWTLNFPPAKQTCADYTNPNKFSYIPYPAGESGDEENLNTNLLGLVLIAPFSDNAMRHRVAVQQIKPV